MIQNNEEYKLIKLDDLEFSVRLYNVARRNSLNTLYDLIESYNSGEFAKLRNVGKNTVEELENYGLVSSVKKQSNVTIDKYNGIIDLKYIRK